MTLQVSTVNATAFSRLFLVACPQCGDIPVAPIAAGLVKAGHISHIWSCDCCGRAFVSSVDVPAGGHLDCADGWRRGARAADN